MGKHEPLTHSRCHPERSASGVPYAQRANGVSVGKDLRLFFAPSPFRLISALASPLDTKTMFRLARPTPNEIELEVSDAQGRLPDCPRLLSRTSGLQAQLPILFAHDRVRSLIGHGKASFNGAKKAFEQWELFNLGWVGVANPDASITVGQIVVVKAHTLGLWSFNLSQIVETISLPTQFGFIYSTTDRHVEQGEERFLIELDEKTNEVWYDIEAVSRPRQTLARIGLPFTRYFQHQFARDSHRKMRVVVQSPNTAP